MTQHIPESRPKIDEAILVFEKIVRGLSETELRSLLDPPIAKGPSLQDRMIQVMRSKSLDMTRQLRNSLGKRITHISGSSHLEFLTFVSISISARLTIFLAFTSLFYQCFLISLRTEDNCTIWPLYIVIIYVPFDLPLAVVVRLIVTKYSCDSVSRGTD